jgi:hypothetical protein
VRNVRRVVLLTSSLLALISCSNGLTPSSATDAIRADLATTSADVADVAVLPGSGRNEAVVRATLDGRQMRLRFRRYHDRWIWEAADSATGSWVAADEVVTQIREATRREKAMDWATKHRDAYVSTVQLLDRYTANLPRRLGSSFDDIGWVPGHAPGDRATRDPWGTEIRWSFQTSERAAVLLSSGSDRKNGTSDDVVLRVTGETAWDDVDKQPTYKYSKRWTVPEGLEGATRAAAGTDTVDVRPSRVVIK